MCLRGLVKPARRTLHNSSVLWRHSVAGEDILISHWPHRVYGALAWMQIAKHAYHKSARVFILSASLYGAVMLGVHTILQV